jgi:ankyrin repeat protein
MEPLCSLPSVLLKFITQFLDFKSLLMLSFTNKRNFQLFSFVRKINVIIKKNLTKDLNLYNMESNVRKENKVLDCILKDEKVNLQMLNYLVQLKSDLNLKNEEGMTPIYYLINNNKVTLEMVQYLIENKADVNIKANFNSSLLIKACQKKKNVEIIKYLIEKKSEINNKELKDPHNFNFIQQNVYKTAIYFCCIDPFPSFEIIRSLVDHKADINMKDLNNEIPLFYASKNENSSFEIIKYLIEKKVI